MKSKLETQLDKEFEQMNVKPWVYHVTDLDMFNGVTIVSPNKQDAGAIEDVVHTIDGFCQHPESVSPATEMREELNDRGFVGVAICDYRDTFSRKRGRIIAKGRLLKQLKKK